MSLRHGLPMMVLLLAAGLCLSCDSLLDSDDEDSPPAQVPKLPAEARGAAVAVLQALDIDAGSLVLIVEEVAPGSILREITAAGDTPVELAVPATDGSYYAFLIDEHPDALLEHPLRFAWMNSASGATGVAAARHEMIIVPPAGEPGPFSGLAYEAVEGVHFCLVTGEGAAEPIGESGQPAPEMTFGLPDPTPSPSETGGSGPASPAVQRLAMVIDGGDIRTSWQAFLVPAYGAYALATRAAAKLNQDANAMGAYLAERGFAVERISQYWEDGSPYLIDAAHFQRVLARKVREFGECPPDSCHELFVFIASHGAEGGLLNFYPKSGGSDMWHIDPEGNLVNYLRLQLPSCVKLSVFLHACYSGALITDYSHDSFCSNHCGLTLLTTTDGEHMALAGRGAADSPIDDFIGDGADKNHDGDPRSGDLYDRFVEMIYQVNRLRLYQRWSQGIPQSYHCPPGTPWCSLDGPTIRPPQSPPAIQVEPEEVSFEHTDGVDPCPADVGYIVIQNVGGAAMTWEITGNDSLTAFLAPSAWVGELRGGQTAEIGLSYACGGEIGILEGDLACVARDLTTGAIVDEVSVHISGSIQGSPLPSVPVLTGTPAIEPNVILGQGEQVTVTLPVSAEASRAQIYLIRRSGTLAIAGYGVKAEGDSTISLLTPRIFSDESMYLDATIYGPSSEFVRSHYGYHPAHSEHLYWVQQYSLEGDSTAFGSDLAMPWVTVR